MTPAVLIIEDEYALAAALATVVRKLGGIATVAASGTTGLQKITEHTFDLVILDVGLPDMNGIEVMKALRARSLPTPVLVITAHGTLETALAARKLGAKEYFLKPLDLAELQRAVKAALSTPLSQAPLAASPDSAMLGHSEGMQRCFAQIAQACRSDLPLWISGASGSGKSLAAEVMHRHSPRADLPLIVFRADAWPAAEMKQALHQAHAQAGSGTLVLDAAESWPLPLQDAWMQLSQSGLRVVSLSTLENRPPGIREDFFYAHSTLRVFLPKLEGRTEDIAALCQAEAGSHTLAPETLALLKDYSWPGQVRELKSAIQHAKAIAGSSVLLPHHLPDDVLRSRDEPTLLKAMRSSLTSWLDMRTTAPDDALPTYDELLEEVEATMLEALLKRFEGKPTRLAAAMQMNRATLRRKLRDEEVPKV
jgi:DNA-binding NtrC family response regulator